MSYILTPFAKLLLLFYNITGSYGVSIILFGLVVRLVLSPIFLKGRKGMLAMSGLAESRRSWPRSTPATGKNTARSSPSSMSRRA